MRTLPRQLHLLRHHRGWWYEMVGTMKGVRMYMYIPRQHITLFTLYISMTLPDEQAAHTARGESLL
jgi:hypothetical protein